MVEQAGEQAFDKPFGHAFSRVLPGDNPYFQVAGGLVADGQQVDVAPLPGAAEVVDLTEATTLGVAEQVEMLLVGIGFEIGIIDTVGQWRVLDGKYAVFVAGGHAEPVAAVVGGVGLVVEPTARVAGVAGVFNVDAAGLVGGALQSEIKPLAEFGGVVATQIESDILTVATVDNGNGTGIEVAADFGHACLVVVKLWFGIVMLFRWPFHGKKAGFFIAGVLNCVGN